MASKHHVTPCISYTSQPWTRILVVVRSGGLLNFRQLPADVDVVLVAWLEMDVVKLPFSHPYL